MKISRNVIKYCFLPFLVVLPIFGNLACSDSDQALDSASATLNEVGKRIVEFPENVETAAPYLKEDISTVWSNLSNQFETYTEDVTVANNSQPEQLQQAMETRDRLISGDSFSEVVDEAMSTLTTDDLENMPTSSLSSLNGVLPFEIDVETCGENLAEVLNNLDIGQVSAILQSEFGYHLIQVLDENGGSLRIGHVVFEIDPSEDAAEESAPDMVAEEADPLQDAIAKLTGYIGNE